MNNPSISELQAALGDIDIYLLDQILKGHIVEGMAILDAGCGNGRNIGYLMQVGLDVHGADHSEEAIGYVRQRAMNMDLPPQNFIVSDLAALPYEAATFDVVICSAVLHFAKDEVHFRSILSELVRVLKPGGMLFSRLSTTIGIEGKLTRVNERHFLMPHGPVWFLADEPLLLEIEKELHLTRLEPLKSTLVEWERSMTTWVLKK